MPRTGGGATFTDGPLRATPAPGAAWQLVAGTGAYGAPVLLIGDTGDQAAYLLGIDATATAALTGAAVRLTLAAATGPEPLAVFRLGALAAGDTIYRPTGFPLRIPAGSRITGTAYSTNGGTLNLGASFAVIA